ncbi:hypothetical protein L6452_09641 [Arctium lappa]|uniref:Uncharacterized protein n=1 Tax=Arctium lappa TaxID=4217 RepID=A0ACB9DL85_ARCLA|nr:hypothetical protein L6452_09641 [Arctium lappa]
MNLNPTKELHGMGVPVTYPQASTHEETVVGSEHQTQPSRSIWSLLTGTFSHGFTYSEHPVACAVAMETHRDSTAAGADLVNRVRIL